MIHTNAEAMVHFSAMSCSSVSHRVGAVDGGKIMFLPFSCMSHRSAVNVVIPPQTGWQVTVCGNQTRLGESSAPTSSHGNKGQRSLRRIS